VQKVGKNWTTLAQFMGKVIACPHKQNLGKNQANFQQEKVC